MSRNFSSDNVTPASAAIMSALEHANTAAVSSYGADEYTARLEEKMSQVFETPVRVFPVTTGTAANALALAQITPPYGAVYCYESAHVVTDECGAPEFFSGGAKLIGFPALNGKISPEQLDAAVALAQDMGVHHVKPGSLSLTQATEWGTVYRLDEVAALAASAKRHGLPVHMDGARLANAVVHLKCSPAEATWRQGVDVLSLGATKNGALCAEAVVFFDASLAHEFERRRKRAGHLWSKMRFLSVQLSAYLEQEHWLTNAAHANSMAQLLVQGLAPLAGVQVLQSVDANEIFIAMPETVIAALERDGFKFYRWPVPTLKNGIAVRLVTSFATASADVAAFVAAAQSAAA